MAPMVARVGCVSIYCTDEWIVWKIMYILDRTRTLLLLQLILLRSHLPSKPTLRVSKRGQGDWSNGLFRSV